MCFYWDPRELQSKVNNSYEDKKGELEGRVSSKAFGCKIPPTSGPNYTMWPADRCLTNHCDRTSLQPTLFDLSTGLEQRGAYSVGAHTYKYMLCTQLQKKQRVTTGQRFLEEKKTKTTQNGKSLNHYLCRFEL